jgi:periplasmic protein TonB
MPVKLSPLILCAGLSTLAHLSLLGVDFNPPLIPTSRPVPSRMEIGLVTMTRRPQFSSAQAPASAPSHSAEQYIPSPAAAHCPPGIPEPVAASFDGEICRPAPRPAPPQPPVLPDPGLDAAKAHRNRTGTAAALPVRSAAPLYADNPPPAYPDKARRNGWSGEVLVRVAVATDGGVTTTDLEASSGYPVLDAAAIAAVRRWRFVPARKGTRAVAGQVLVPVRFRLTGSAE